MGNWGWSYLTARDKRAILRGIEDDAVYGGPYHVEIQPCDRCDIDCSFCSTRTYRNDDDLSIDALDSLVRDMREIGTYAVTLCGGGEPLFYRHRERMFDLLGEAGIALDHATTNGVSMNERCARSILSLRCASVIVSLTAADPGSYARIMRRPERTFHVVVENIRRFVELRGRRRTPRINVQFMIYPETYRSIPRMYELATTLGVDQILFREPILPPDLALNETETEELIALLEQVLVKDQYVRVGSIQSFQRNLSAPLQALHERVKRRRPALWLRRIGTIFRSKEWPWSSKLRHQITKRFLPRSPALIRMSDGCLTPWLTLTVRADGSVPVCCVLQTRKRAHIPEQRLREIWHGEAFAGLRRQMRRSILLRDSWKPDDANGLQMMCAWDKSEGEHCNFRNFFYFMDHDFVRDLHGATARVRGVDPAITAAEARPVPVTGV